MAVLDEFTVEVIVDGQPAHEYDDDDDTQPDSDTSITKYIEAVSGKGFHFAIKIDPKWNWGEADTVTIRPTIDGKKTRGICFLKKKHMQRPNSPCILEGEWSGMGTSAQLLKYVFATIETRELRLCNGYS
jgi:hypothetical protein